MSVVSGLRPLLVCSALFAIAQLAPAQTKVGVVNLQQAVFKTAEITKADAQMQATFKPRQDKIDQLQKEIAALAQQLQSSAGKLSPAAEQDLTAQGQRKQRDLQRMQDDLNADATAYRNDVLSKSSAKMQEIIKKLAEEKGLDLVVDTSTTLYFKPALDLTSEATAAYDKAYPAK
ncbi:MAG TPA: OmpH family outer membrane protein [Bryobacteraceae bacterium]|nr:OmpH family outer membrane protein [Bryobacteraceae bacterium]